MQVDFHSEYLKSEQKEKKKTEWEDYLNQKRISEQQITDCDMTVLY